MKRLLVFSVFAVFLLLATVSAGNLEIESISKGDIVIREANNPAYFDLVIDNKGNADTFEIYSFVGVTFSPRGTFDLPTGKSTVEIGAFLGEDLRQTSGALIIEYEIRGQDTGITKGNLQITVIGAEDLFSLKGEDVVYGDESVKVILKNRKDVTLPDVNVKLDSPFFTYEEETSFQPLEEKELEISFNKNITGFYADSYNIGGEINFVDASTSVEGSFNYVEEESSSSNKEGSGFLVRTVLLEKVNEGNVNTKIELKVTRNVLTRLFTTFDVEPENVERRGLFIHYAWTGNLKPGEKISVVATTNYTFPFILILLIIIAIVIIRHVFVVKTLSVKKRVSLVKTKGGEFALKVVLHVKSKKHLTGVRLVDKLPGATKLYEKFGRRPDEIDEASRTLRWNIANISKGEQRVFSYVIYSKLRVVGRFELPSAYAIFEEDGEQKTVQSNRTSFASESVSSDY
ncbi:MAG: hypothetical protein CL811_04635 [Colwelliaceae bacterium]|nr:hypothetical protein [Colwelliaceae bacterium]|tara:strand:+ start:1314 stop:2690 length:1377 start_codon:yes stop_codon:yes gene_type:complete